jgi:hypothetical protein
MLDFLPSRGHTGPVRALGVIAFLSMAACTEESSAFLRKTWPEDQAAVVVLARENGEVIETFLIQPGAVDRRELTELEGPVIVHARVYRELARREPLSDCTIRTGGSLGDVLGEPAFAWRSAPIELGRDEIVLDVDQTPASFDLRVAGCAKRPASCDVILSFVETPPTPLGLRDVAAIYPDTAIGAGAQVMRFDDVTTTLLEVRELNGLASVVVRHGLNAVITLGGTIVEVDRLGQTLSSTSVSSPIADGATGLDGTTLLITDEGRILELTSSAAAITPFASPAYATLGVEIPRISVARRDRVLIAGPDGRLYSWNGIDWRRELPMTESFDAIAADEHAMFVVPTDDQTLLREGDGEWRAIGAGFLTTRATSAVSIGEGRFLAVGQSGSAIYWNGEQICKLSAATNLNFEDADFYPGSHVGYLVGENDRANTPALVVRAEVFVE